MRKEPNKWFDDDSENESYKNDSYNDDLFDDDLYDDDVCDDDKLYFEDFGLNVNKVNEYYEDDYPRERFDKEQERQKKDE